MPGYALLYAVFTIPRQLRLLYARNFSVPSSKKRTRSVLLFLNFSTRIESIQHMPFYRFFSFVVKILFASEIFGNDLSGESLFISSRCVDGHSWRTNSWPTRLHFFPFLKESTRGCHSSRSSSKSWRERINDKDSDDKRWKITFRFTRRYLDNPNSYRDKTKSVLKGKVPRF